MARTKNPTFPVTVTQLPLVRCTVCGRTLPHRLGKAAEVLTEHYSRAHPEMLGLDPEQE